MQICQGKSVGQGIAIGKLYVYLKKEQSVKRNKIDDTALELERFHKAVQTSIEQLQRLYETSVQSIGEANAAIFEIHQMMLEDLDFIEAIENIITTQEVNSEYAVATTSDNFFKMFSDMDDEYMKARAADIKDISERVLTVLSGGSMGMKEMTEPVIILADDLAPSETVQLDKEKVLAFVTVHGSINSHTAILAKTMSIPALVATNVELSSDLNGLLAVVDGYEGKLFIEPEEEQRKILLQRKEKEEEQKELLQQLKGKDNVTLDGKQVKLYANIGNSKDLAFVKKNDAGGIGLFRSEFIYLESSTYPTEEEQFQIYKTVAETMAGKKVIIRTLDIGADKQVDYFQMEKEENPAMGIRAIRICLTRPDLFKTQLRALYRASAYGNIAIMYPMIISMEEIKQIKQLSKQVRDELEQENIRIGEVEEGIMIETPAAVIMSDEFAKEVDFFSIGTNDLTQYTLAIDRQNEKTDAFYNAHHPAVLRMIQMVIDNAHRAGIWAGICGELAGDLALTETFLKMGVDELSVSPGKILPLRKKIRETDTSR